MYQRIKHIYFVGIGGAGMSGIAEVLLNLDYKVSGSDIKLSEITERLKRLGATIYQGHSENHITDVDVVVTSSAVKSNNPEVSAARSRAIPVIPRAEMLAELMRLKYGIAVAGAHGKTTTTSLIGIILDRGGISPTVVNGGILNTINTNAILGTGDFMVAEADESDGSFLKLSPTIAIITNIDSEHLDYYQNITEIKRAFIQFANKVPFYGLNILCLDNEYIQDLIPLLEKRYLTYGLTPQADLQAREVTVKGLSMIFRVYYHNEELGKVELKMPGLHNVYNALAAIATAVELNLDFSVTKEALKTFEGVKRRFQIKGESNGITLVDDYGHHPTEIKATLSTAKNIWEGRLVVVFQPHRYTRTRDLFKDFLTAFNQADLLLLTDIYPAGEDPLPGVNVETLCHGIREHGHKNVYYHPQKEETVEYLTKLLQPGDVVITLGAGNIWQLGEQLLQNLRQ
ncbi:MAG: UDP-N-acetylmuramate--L-alanine ligase [Deltaproteobacteria bacterium]|jgi:UDP-N-acetylmuramate--alanine ligase|nr:UDP-N-acetylmuramate--L-alanine ligase [Deltaproteobacteria bacterium]